MKIGEIITISKPYEIDNGIKKVKVKAGDRGFMDSRGCIHYITGEARGKIQKIHGAYPKGYANKDIARLIGEHLKGNFTIMTDNKYSLLFWDMEINEIESILNEIL